MPPYYRVRCTSTTPSTKRKTIFSGIQPTGVPHIGNYFGTLQQWVDLQTDEYNNLIFSLVDLHALTTPHNVEQLKRNKNDALISLLAIGIDPSRCIIFEQSSVPEHAELAWILGCLTPMGFLDRMTQYKSKKKDCSNTLGLFAYPVLQAADILLYNATHVPVGQDQAQHLELTRTLAERFNKAYGVTFNLPETLHAETKKVFSLRDPSSKMSKSDPNRNSTVYLTDTAEEIQKKINASVTDSISGVSFDPVARPGLSNLVQILAAALHTDCKSIAELQQFSQHSEFKSLVANTLIRLLGPIQDRISVLRRDPAYIQELKRQGSKRAAEKAKEMMQKIHDNVGLL